MLTKYFYEDDINTRWSTDSIYFPRAGNAWSRDIDSRVAYQQALHSDVTPLTRYSIYFPRVV